MAPPPDLGLTVQVEPLPQTLNSGAGLCVWRRHWNLFLKKLEIVKDITLKVISAAILTYSKQPGLFEGV